MICSKLQAEPNQRQTWLEYWEQFCHAFVALDKGNAESAWHRLEIMLDKVMTLDLDESTYERVTTNLIQVYSSLLSKHSFTVAENFLRKVITWPTWKKHLLQRKQISTRMNFRVVFASISLPRSRNNAFTEKQ